MIIKKRAAKITKRKTSKKKDSQNWRTKQRESIRVFRGGVSESAWYKVCGQPLVSHNHSYVSISTNISKKPAAQKQSEIQTRIPSEVLIELFETHFELGAMGVGDLAMALRDGRRAIKTLVEVIECLKDDDRWSAGHLLDEVSLTCELVDNPTTLQTLKKLQSHKWD